MEAVERLQLIETLCKLNEPGNCAFVVVPGKLIIKTLIREERVAQQVKPMMLASYRGARWSPSCPISDPVL